jgi:tartrate-resistant acid phosphatase type 5
MDAFSEPSRRRFLRQSFSFSALAGLQAAFGALPGLAVAADPDAAQLLILGDWGYEDAQAQTVVADGLRAYAKKHAVHPQALLMLGDNWYGELAGGVHSPRWQTQFEEMYPASEFPCPVYAVLGNHDYQRYPESKVDAELAYAHSGGGPTRWTMPARWYRFTFPATNPLITFLALDSNMPRPDGKEKGRDFTLTPGEQAEQLAWLTTELARPRTTPYLGVIAHHPVYSDGPHGDHAVLIRDWDPLFRKHRVDVYMAGHDHDLQHLEFAGHPTSFFLSGGGGADLYPLKIEPSQRGPYAQKVYGFSHISLSASAMTLRHLDERGNLVHAFSRTPEGKLSILT